MYCSKVYNATTWTIQTKAKPTYNVNLAEYGCKIVWGKRAH